MLVEMVLCGRPGRQESPACTKRKILSGRTNTLLFPQPVCGSWKWFPVTPSLVTLSTKATGYRCCCRSCWGAAEATPALVTRAHNYLCYLLNVFAKCLFLFLWNATNLRLSM